MARFFGTESRHEGGAYDTYTARDDRGRKWKAMNDSSLVPQKKVNGEIMDASNHYRTEVVSPILSYEDIPKLQELVRMLRKAGAFANKSCGIHIHVGAERFTAKTLRNLVNIMASKEDMIYRALQINPSRESRYCRKTNTTFLKDLNRKKPDTMDGIADLWYQEAPYGRDYHYNSTRYHGLNLHSTFTKGTVEFRLFNGTLHAGEIKAYIQFCLAVVHQPSRRKRPRCGRPKRTMINTPSGAGCSGWDSSVTNSRPAGSTSSNTSRATPHGATPPLEGDNPRAALAALGVVEGHSLQKG